MWGVGDGGSLVDTPTCSVTCLRSQVEPFLPYEYTCEGMLERVNAYIQNQVGGVGTGPQSVSQNVFFKGESKISKNEWQKL